MKSKILLAAIVALWTTSALAVPNGKPFVELEGQIIEVQGAVAEIEARMTELEQSTADQISTLRSEVEALDSTVETIEAKIYSIERTLSGNKKIMARLQRSYATLSRIVIDIKGDITTLQGSIDTLTAANVELQVQVDAGDTLLQSQIDENTKLIIDLEVVMADNNVALTDLVTNNTNLIDELQIQIDQLVDMIAMQTNIENGICPDGQSVVAVSEGQIVCELVDGASSTTVSQHRAYSVGRHIGGGFFVGNATCPEGSILTGGGIFALSVPYEWFISKPALENDISILLSGGGASAGARTWYTQTRHYHHYGYAVCLAFN